MKTALIYQTCVHQNSGRTLALVHRLVFINLDVSVAPESHQMRSVTAALRQFSVLTLDVF